MLAASLTPPAITKFRLWREIGVKVLSARAVCCFFFYVFNLSLYYFNNNTVFFYPFILFCPIVPYPLFKEGNKWREEKTHQGVRGFLSCSAPRVQITVGAFWPVTVRVWCPWFSNLFILNNGSLPLSHSHKHKHTAISRHIDQRRDGGN